MLLKKDTIAIQNQLATYCRDGQPVDIEGARKDRLHNYRRLVCNIVDDALRQAYPITLSILTEKEWNGLIHDYFSKHDPQSYQIWKMPYELYEFAEASAYHEKLDKPYLLELLYFEWIEIEVYCMPDGEIGACTTNGDAINDRLIINPDHRLLHLTYPVHKKSARELETAMGNYFVLVFRQLDTGQVQFIEISPLFAFVVERLSAGPASVLETFKAAGEVFGMTDTDSLIVKGSPFIAELMRLGAILGYADHRA